MSRVDYDAVVVGGGAIGAAAALALSKSGQRVALIELNEPRAWSREVPDLRVFALAADSIELLRSLGAWDRIASSRAQPYRRMQVWDISAPDYIEFDADKFGRRELGCIVENSLIQDALWEQVRASNIRVILGNRVISVDGEMVQLEDGTLLRASHVIAADGAQSSIRSLLGVEVSGTDYHQKGLVAFIDHTSTNQATCWQRFVPSGPIAFLPFGEKRSSIVWTLPTDECDRLFEVDDATFLCELSNAFDGPVGELTAVSKRAAFPLRQQIASTFLSGNVLFIGDAAHVVHPLAGQGVNLGFRDVIALRDLYQARRVSQTSLAKWARTRKSESTLAAQSFTALNSLFSNDDVLPVLIRGKGLGLVNRIPGASLWFWKKAAGLS